jgi:hypothetical protein
MTPPPAGAAAPPVAVVDIDGVVADVRHRVPYLEQFPPDWMSFFSEAGLDPPLPVGVARVHALLAEGHEVVWLTGRPEWLRGKTAAWLARQGLPGGVLLMRPNGDRRPAARLKSAAVRALADGRRVFTHVPDGPRDIVLVLDDDTSVVATLRAAGWPVEQADWVGLSMEGFQRLHQAQEAEGRT